MKFYFGDLLPYIGEMFAGLGLNVLLALVSMVIGALGGILLYLGKTGKHRTVSLVCRAYIEVMRNTPLLVQLT